MKTNFNLLFYLKKPKDYTTGAVPIYLRITVNGKRAELASGKECIPEQWNSKSGHMRGTKEEIKTINSYLDKMKADLNAAYTALCIQDEQVTTESIKCRYLGKAEKSHTLGEAIQLHNKNMKELIGKDYAPGTLRRFEVLERHVSTFLSAKYNKTDINLNSIDYEFISDFDFYLRTEKVNTNNTAIKHLKNLGKIVRICLSKKWISSDQFFGYKLKSKAVHRNRLSTEELQKILDKDFTTKRLSQVRDFFLFSCYTGLSYADVQKLKQSDISTGIDGGQWIFSHRQKTDTRLAIPLLPVANEILDKYKDHPECINKDRALPISSSQKMNEYLVEIAAIAGVDKKLNNRIAKRTYGTTVLLKNGVPIETVSKLLGHMNIRTTMLYVDISDIKVGEDTAHLRKAKPDGTIEISGAVTESKISHDIAPLMKKYA